MSHPRNVILQGDCRTVLNAQADEHGAFVDSVVTSPPYWALRKYPGVEPSVWGDPGGCEHVWGNETRVVPGRKEGVCGKTATVGATRSGAQEFPYSQGSYCVPCGAWRGLLGLEPTPDQYVANIVECFRAVKRVLKPWGTAWVNLGDSYAGGGTCGGARPGDGGAYKGGADAAHRTMGKQTPPGLKPKDLCGIPWRVALALQADGWYLRSAIVWAKGLSFCPTYAGSVMPESCTDRPTSAYEMLFLFAHPDSGGKYYYDAEAVRERAETAGGYGGFTTCQADAMGRKPSGSQLLGMDYALPSTRNLRNVWAINPQPSKLKHYAQFPDALVIPCIKAGTSAKGNCPACGKPWRRVVEKHTGAATGASWHDHTVDDLVGQHKDPGEHFETYRRGRTTGWQPTCSCCGYLEAEDQGALDPVPAIVLDLFMGSGTTARVAQMLLRDFLGVDASSEYAKLGAKQAADVMPLFAHTTGDAK